jgi:hypothetical protein
VLPSESRRRLSPDGPRTWISALLSLLTFGGFAYAVAQPQLRAALSAESPTWWAEQVVILAQAIACLGIVALQKAFVRPAIVLTTLALAFGLLHWFQALGQGHVSIPVRLLLDVILVSRLLAARVPGVAPPAG